MQRYGLGVVSWGSVAAFHTYGSYGQLLPPSFLPYEREGYIFVVKRTRSGPAGREILIGVNRDAL